MWSNNQTNWTVPVPSPIQGQNPNPTFVSQIPFSSDESRKRKAVEVDLNQFSHLAPQSYFSSNVHPPIRPNSSNSFTFLQENTPHSITPILNGAQLYYTSTGTRPFNTGPDYSPNESNINNVPNFMNYMSGISENRPPFISIKPFSSEIPKLTNEKITAISGTNPCLGYNNQVYSSNERNINIVQNFMNRMSGVCENRPPFIAQKPFFSGIPKLTNEKFTTISVTTLNEMDVQQKSMDSTSKISEEGKLENEGNNGKEGKIKGLVREKLWDGTLQLNASTTVSVLAFFKSGEKNKDIVWPKSLEIKGKVRLQAFEKFIKQLPHSRSRSLMVISLCWKITSSSSGLTGMKEVAIGYNKSEKVGFAEISPGLDLYICPRTETIITILAKHGFFKGIMAIEEDQDSLIGCVVSRKNQKPSNPSSSSLSETKIETQKDQKEISSSNEVTENGPQSDSDAQEKVKLVSTDAKVKDCGTKPHNTDDDLPEFDFPVNSIPITSRASEPKPFNLKKDNIRNNRLWNDDDNMPEWSPPSYPPLPPLPPKMATENQSQTLKSVPIAKEQPSQYQKGILGPPPDSDFKYSHPELKSSLDRESRNEHYRWHRN